MTTTTVHHGAARKDEARLCGLLHGTTIGQPPINEAGPPFAHIGFNAYGEPLRLRKLVARERSYSAIMELLGIRMEGQR